MFASVKAVPLSRHPAKVLIKWEARCSGAELKDYEFLVERQSAGQDGNVGFQHVDIDGNPYKPSFLDSKDPKNLRPISTWIDGLDFPWYVDYSETLKGLTLPLWYRVQARNKSTQEVVSSEMFSWDGPLDLVGLYVVDEHNFMLRDVTGVPSLVFQRKRSGVHCTVCFDHIQKKRLSSSCKKCYGTNYVGGFYQPIDCYIDFNPNPKVVNIEAWGATQPNETDTLLSNFPNVEPGDVIKELRENRMWRVVRVTLTEKRRVPMLQFARVIELKPGDIEYTLPNDERFQLKKIQELEDTKQKPEF
jgi:hypothetical protein